MLDHHAVALAERRRASLGAEGLPAYSTGAMVATWSVAGAIVGHLASSEHAPFGAVIGGVLGAAGGYLTARVA